MDNLKTFRHLNTDHLIVGWYQSSLFGNFANKDFIESQFMYQTDFSESIALIYGLFISISFNSFKTSLIFSLKRSI
jgi:hypothetical protein